MANTYLKGVLGFKGERGYSAYDIAVQNGFKGTQEQWLATLGTSSTFEREKVVYVTSTENEATFNLPSSYVDETFSFVDVYVNGFMIDSEKYTVNQEAKTITLLNPLEQINTRVEIVALTMSTNDLPIVSAMSSESTNDTAIGALAVYNALLDKEDKKNKVTSIDLSSTDAKYPSAKAVYDALNSKNTEFDNKLNNKIDSSRVAVVTGSTGSIAQGSTAIVDVQYPAGFNKSNTLLISKMCSNNGVYYDTNKIESTANGFPIITMVALTDDNIRLWFANNNSAEAKLGYYKLTLMKQ